MHEHATNDKQRNQSIWTTTAGLDRSETKKMTFLKPNTHIGGGFADFFHREQLLGCQVLRKEHRAERSSTQFSPVQEATDDPVAVPLLLSALGCSGECFPAFVLPVSFGDTDLSEISTI
jgi:hypothetical protein